MAAYYQEKLRVNGCILLEKQRVNGGILQGKATGKWL